MLKKLNWKLLALLATISYPFLIHYWVLTSQYIAASVYISFLLLIFTIRNYMQGHKVLAVVLGIIFGLVCSILIYDQKLIMFFPPVIIPLGLAYIFTKSLLNGHVAYITQIAEKIRKAPLPNKEIIYTRNITIVWAGVFVFFTIEASLIAMFAEIETWSYVTNFLNYLLIVIIVVVEYIVRRAVLHDIDHPGFIEFIKKLIKVQKKY